MAKSKKKVTRKVKQKVTVSAKTVNAIMPAEKVSLAQKYSFKGLHEQIEILRIEITQIHLVSLKIKTAIEALREKDIETPEAENKQMELFESAPSTVTDAITKDDISKALNEVIETSNLKKGMAVLAKFGCERISEVPSSEYQTFIDLCKKTMKKSKKSAEPPMTEPVITEHSITSLF